MIREDLSLYLVTDRELACGRPLRDVVAQAVEGGVTMVQLREKDIDTREFISLACELKSLLSPFGVPLIINDRVDVALACDADGVHIGQSDMPYGIARKLLGPGKIIGLSVENMQQVEEANGLDVDYIGVSPVYSTTTKTDTAPPFGLEGLKEAVRISRHPTVAIGGMNSRTVSDVMDCGTDGIAVVSAIMSAESPREASAALLETIKTKKMNTKWSEQAWKKASRIYGAILDQPFLKEMADGSLDVSKFDRYLAQDEIYVGNYGRSMFALADIIPDPQEKELFEEFAREGIESERMMHQLLIDRFGIETEVESSIVTRTYNAHTEKAVATGVKEIGLAAILPCAWVYNEVGKDILRIARMEGNPYKEWMAEYGNEEFTKGVQLLVDMADRWAETVSEEVRDAMTDAFIEATLFEYAFWDYGYEGEAKDYSYMLKTEDWL